MKTVDMSFLNIMLCYYFSLEAVLEGMAQKSKSMQKLRDIKACSSLKTLRRENVNFYKLQTNI